MRVVGVDEFGGPEVLRVFEIPEQHAGPGEVGIAVKAAAVNPTDTLTRSGARAEMLKSSPPPYVPGMDVAGTVDEVGHGVSSPTFGEHVMAIVVPHGSYGGYSEHVVVPAESVANIPAGERKRGAPDSRSRRDSRTPHHHLLRPRSHERCGLTESRSTNFDKLRPFVGQPTVAIASISMSQPGRASALTPTSVLAGGSPVKNCALAFAITARASTL